MFIVQRDLLTTINYTFNHIDLNLFTVCQLLVKVQSEFMNEQKRRHIDVVKFITNTQQLRHTLFLRLYAM